MANSNIPSEWDSDKAADKIAKALYGSGKSWKIKKAALKNELWSDTLAKATDLFDSSLDLAVQLVDREIKDYASDTQDKANILSLVNSNPALKALTKVLYDVEALKVAANATSPNQTTITTAITTLLTDMESAVVAANQYLPASITIGSNPAADVTTLLSNLATAVNALISTDTSTEVIAKMTSISSAVTAINTGLPAFVNAEKNYLTAYFSNSASAAPYQSAAKGLATAQLVSGALLGLGAAVMNIYQQEKLLEASDAAPDGVTVSYLNSLVANSGVTSLNATSPNFGNVKKKFNTLVTAAEGPA